MTATAPLTGIAQMVQKSLKDTFLNIRLNFSSSLSVTLILMGAHGMLSFSPLTCTARLSGILLKTKHFLNCRFLLITISTTENRNFLVPSFMYQLMVSALQLHVYPPHQCDLSKGCLLSRPSLSGSIRRFTLLVFLKLQGCLDKVNESFVCFESAVL